MHIPSSADNGPLNAVPVRATTPPETMSIPAAPRTSGGPWNPPVDIKVLDKEIVVYADLPGIDEDELFIDILPHSMTVEGERVFDHDQEDAEDYVQLDRPYGPFQVQVDFPHAVDPNQATAKYRRGVLRVRVPFADRTFRGRRVTP